MRKFREYLNEQDYLNEGDVKITEAKKKEVLAYLYKEIGKIKRELRTTYNLCKAIGIKKEGYLASDDIYAAMCIKDTSSMLVGFLQMVSFVTEDNQDVGTFRAKVDTMIMKEPRIHVRQCIKDVYDNVKIILR